MFSLTWLVESRMSDRIPRNVRRLFRLPLSAAQLRRDLDDEIRFHLDMRIAELRAKGMSEDEAERAALAQFGNPDELKEYSSKINQRRVRRVVALDWFREAGQDLRFGLRQLRRAPGFAATAIIMSALGIGAN